MEAKICEDCGKAVNTQAIAKLEHTPGEWVVVKPPTEAEKGLEEQRCTVCKELLGSNEIPALIHTHV